MLYHLWYSRWNVCILHCIPGSFHNGKYSLIFQISSFQIKTNKQSQRHIKLTLFLQICHRKYINLKNPHKQQTESVNHITKPQQFIIHVTYNHNIYLNLGGHPEMVTVSYPTYMWWKNLLYWRFWAAHTCGPWGILELQALAVIAYRPYTLMCDYTVAPYCKLYPGVKGSNSKLILFILILWSPI